MLNDLVTDFLFERYENLDQLDKDLMALESAPDDRSWLFSIFRTIHTIEGPSGVLAFPKLEHNTHVGENRPVGLHNVVLHLNAEITSGPLSMMDAMSSILGQIDNSESEGEEACEALVVTLGRLKNGESAAPPAAPASATNEAEIEVEQVIREVSNNVAAAVAQSTTKSKKSKSSKSKTKAVSSEAVPKATSEQVMTDNARHTNDCTLRGTTQSV
jgi:two-component system chemotaxis sensor kinase CheA